ncbi:hypothetical protein [Nocardia sp. NPDC050175]|uniref:hypothetical protein n=1 Tax=Nocardia sp. NPDC050175 TaxID=3364317 RepID=UPI0037BDDF30
MRMPLTTSLLSRVAVGIRSNRREYIPPAGYLNQVTPQYAEAWFPTKGCFWDAMGHCTTCNYGVSVEVSPDQMVRAAEIAVDSLAPSTRTLWISAFDTLHDREVPPATRREIFAVLARSPVDTILTEAHPASVRSEKVQECVELLDGRTFGIQLGVETMDEFIRYACVNKPYSNTLLARAVDVIHDSDAVAYANLIAGIPFLTEREVVAQTALSVRQAISIGFDQIVLFPNHVKEHTIAFALAESNRYSPPDLWTIRDVLAAVSDLVSEIHLAWLDLKPHPGAAEVSFEPSRVSTKRLYDLLNQFDHSRSYEPLQEAFDLIRPHTQECTETSLKSRLLDGYQWLARTFGHDHWWVENEDKIAVEIQQGLSRSSVDHSTESLPETDVLPTRPGRVVEDLALNIVDSASVPVPDLTKGGANG